MARAARLVQASMPDRGSNCQSRARTRRKDARTVGVPYRDTAARFRVPVNFGSVCRLRQRSYAVGQLDPIV